MPRSSLFHASRFARALTFVGAVAFTAPLTGCLGSTNPNPSALPGEHDPIAVTAVPEERFADRTVELLLDGEPSTERLSLLVGIVQRQLAHADERYASGDEEGGTRAVMGALMLMQQSEARREMLDGPGRNALLAAIERVSAEGDEGTAFALLKLALGRAEPGSPQHDELSQHLEALNQWMRDTRTGPPIVVLGAEERARARRALVDAKPEALRDATGVISEWVDRGIDHNLEFRRSGRRPSREEVVEATRALETGAATLAGLYLRYGQVDAAVQAVETSSVRRIIDPQFYVQLLETAEEDTPRAWQGLIVAFAREASNMGGEVGMDPAVVRAAFFGIAREAFERAPEHFPTAQAMARALITFGLPEASPVVLARALGDEPSPDQLSAALALVHAALAEEANKSQTAAARRIMAAAEPLVALADRPQYEGRLLPSGVDLRLLMATVELREGDLGRARPLLTKAVVADPSAAGFRTLAMLERQGGDAKAALAYLEQAMSTPSGPTATLDVVDANLLAFEIHREQGDAAAAQSALDDALRTVLDVRASQDNVRRKARAESLLGRILLKYGKVEDANRALTRALSIAESDRRVMGAVSLDVVGRALVAGDVELGRMALRHAMRAEIEEHDLVYAALWVQLLERTSDSVTDGTAQEAFEMLRERDGWVGKLAAWGQGELSDRELIEAAHTEPERVEAHFYVAMAGRAAGEASASESLNEVADSGVIDLLEVHLAREILAPPSAPKLPAGLPLP